MNRIRVALEHYSDAYREHINEMNDERVPTRKKQVHMMLLEEAFHMWYATCDTEHLSHDTTMQHGCHDSMVCWETSVEHAAPLKGQRNRTRHWMNILITFMHNYGWNSGEPRELFVQGMVDAIRRTATTYGVDNFVVADSDTSLQEFYSSKSPPMYHTCNNNTPTCSNNTSTCNNNTPTCNNNTPTIRTSYARPPLVLPYRGVEHLVKYGTTLKRYRAHLSSHDEHHGQDEHTCVKRKRIVPMLIAV